MTTVIVAGAESTGTRLMCRWIDQAGGVPHHAAVPLSTSRDLPDGVWLPFPAEADQAVVMFRDLNAVIRCQTDLHVPSVDVALDRVQRAYPFIFEQLARIWVPWFPVTYESLSRPGAVEAVLRLLGLDGTVTEPWRDGNAKYYGEAPYERVHPNGPPLVQVDWSTFAQDDCPGCVERTCVCRRVAMNDR